MTNSLSGLRSFFRPWARDLVDVASRARVLPRVTSTLRSHTYQAKLYRDYLAGRNPYPVAPPGSSAHELGLAFDMVTSPMEALTDLGKVWEDWGGVWGGRFGDEVHFEFPGASQHAAKQASQLPAEIAGGVAGLIPGPVGWLASIGPLVEGKPLFTYDPKTTIWCRVLGVGCGN